MERKYISVTDFTTVLKRIFYAEDMLKNVAVLGEVSGFKISGGHAYFTLKDKESALPCSCFYVAKTHIPKDGDSVICVGGPDFYQKGGRFSFVVQKIEPYGEGLILKQIEELKKKLAAEGLFDASRKKPIPRFNKEVCVVTSKTGAVIRDIVKTVRLKNPVIDIVVKDVRVQGAGAEKEIAAALKSVDELGFDAVILARGGGSLEDLMPFYTEDVARALYEMQTPVISAVGHETDFSIADMAADLRAATPTAAGEAVAYDYYALRQNILDNLERQRVTVSKRVLSGFEKTKYLATSINLKTGKHLSESVSKIKILNLKMQNCVQSKLTAACKNLEKTSLFMQNSVAAKLSEKEHLIEKALLTLDAKSPVKTLEKGYFKIYSGGKPLSAVKGVKVGDRIAARGADGAFEAVVDKVEDKI